MTLYEFLAYVSACDIIEQERYALKAKDDHRNAILNAYYTELYHRQKRPKSPEELIQKVYASGQKEEYTVEELKASMEQLKSMKGGIENARRNRQGSQNRT